VAAAGGGDLRRRRDGLLVGGTPGGVLLPSLALLSLAIAGLFFVAWALAAWRNPDWRPRSVLLPALAAGLGSMAISTVFSRSQRLSADNLAYATILVGLYLLLLQLLSRPLIRSRVVTVAALVGVAISIAYIAIVGEKWIEFWTLIGKLATPPLRPDFASLVYDNPAPVLMMAVLLGGVGVGWAAGLPRFRMPIAVAIVTLASLTALLTGTRGGWFAIAGGLAVIALIAVSRPESRSRLVSPVRRWLGHRRTAVPLIGIVTLGLAIVVVLAPAVLRRIGAGGEDIRSSLYVASLRMFLDAPVVGVGPGLWAAQRIVYTAPTEPDSYVPHGHDIYLQGLAEMGVVGLLAGAVAAGFVVWLLRDALRDPDPARRRWGWVACFTTVYFAFHEVVDFHLNIPATLLALAIPLALLDATATNRPTFRLPLPTRISARPVLALAAATIAAAVLLAGWSEVGASRALDAVGYANTGDWQTAGPIAAAAADIDPRIPAYALVDGLAAAHRGDSGTALAMLEAVATAGDLPEAWVDVAALEAAAGHQTEARAALDRASRLGLQRPAVAIAITDLAIRLGEPEHAIQAAASALVERPSLAGDPWWTTDPARAALFPAMLARAREVSSPAARWELSLMTGDSTAARTDTADAANPAFAATVIDAWTGDVAAVSQLDALCEADPLNGPIAWCARVASHDGDQQAAARYRRWDVFLNLDDGDALAELRVSVAPTEPTVAGGIAYVYPLDAYRRFGIWDLLVPGLPHLVRE